MVAFTCHANGYFLCFNNNGSCLNGNECIGCLPGWRADNSLFRASNCSLPDGFYLAYLLFSILFSGGFFAYFLHVLLKRGPRSNVRLLVIENLVVNLASLGHAVAQYAEDGAYEATLVFYSVMIGSCVIWGATLSITTVRLVYTLRPREEFLRLRRGMIAFYTLQFFAESLPPLVAAGYARSPDVSSFNAAVVATHYNIAICSLICIVIFFYGSHTLMRKLDEAVDLKDVKGGTEEGSAASLAPVTPRGGRGTGSSFPPIREGGGDSFDGGGGGGGGEGGEEEGGPKRSGIGNTNNSNTNTSAAPSLKAAASIRETKMKDVRSRLEGMRQQYYGLIGSLLILIGWGTTQVTLGSFPFSWIVLFLTMGGMQLSIPLTTWEAVNKRTLETGGGSSGLKGAGSTGNSKDSKEESSFTGESKMGKKKKKKKNTTTAMSSSVEGGGRGRGVRQQ